LLTGFLIVGTYYSAVALIGYKISTEKFFKTSLEKRCSHTIKAGAAFCPKCGAKTGLYERHSVIDEYDDLREELDTPPNGYVSEVIDGEQFIYIGYGVTCDSQESNMKSLKDYDENKIKDKIAEFLLNYVELQLITLDENSFGLWVLLPGH
jgi:hypothetical protein